MKLSGKRCLERLTLAEWLAVVVRLKVRIVLGGQTQDCIAKFLESAAVVGAMAAKKVRQELNSQYERWTFIFEMAYAGTNAQMHNR